MLLIIHWIDDLGQILGSPLLPMSVFKYAGVNTSNSLRFAVIIPNTKDTIPTGQN